MRGRGGCLLLLLAGCSRAGDAPAGDLQTATGDMAAPLSFEEGPDMADDASQPTGLNWASPSCAELAVTAPTCAGTDLVACDPQFDCGEPTTFSGYLCNLGQTSTIGPVVGTFYFGSPWDPTAPPLRICTARTNGPLARGECEEIHCQLFDASTDYLVLRVNDDGKIASVAPDCNPENNISLYFDSCTLG